VAADYQGKETRTLETAKAWKEMIHRYLASVLGLIILIMAILAWRNRDDPGQPILLPTLLVCLVIFQGLLGMWTVTLLLKPIFVTAHLLGGITTLLLLFWLLLKMRKPKQILALYKQSKALFPLAVFAIIILYGQIFLGGWTSSNYAALICPDFPTCQGQWWPVMDIKEGFTMWRGLGIDYEFGVLKTGARTAVHMMHRVGALITFLIIICLVFIAIKNEMSAIRHSAILVMVLLFAQISLGIANIKLGLPLHLAVAHNGVAALLLLSLALLLNNIMRVRNH
jgi:cytochrome c oxidase assembly protein subunit 15